MSYNGWANYATWKVMLEILDGYIPAQEPVKAHQLEEYDLDLVLNEIPENSFAVHCVNDFLGDVDWYEIAEHINEDYELI